MQFTGSEVAVFNPLAHIVLVDRITEVLEVIGIDLGIGLGGFGLLRDFELSGRGGEADLDSVGVTPQNFRPLAPSRAVALVNDDVAKIVGWVMRGQETRRPVL